MVSGEGKGKRWSCSRVMLQQKVLLADSDVGDSRWRDGGVEDGRTDGSAHMLSNFFNTYGAVDKKM